MLVINYKPGYGSAQINASYPQKQSTNNGITHGRMSMPKKFSVADSGNSFSLGRTVYSKSTLEYQTLYKLNELYNKQSTVRQKTAKGINYESSSQHIEKLKNIAIGKGSTSINKNLEKSFKSQDNVNRNTVKSALRKARNKGYVPPKKAAHFYL